MISQTHSSPSNNRQRIRRRVSSERALNKRTIVFIVTHYPSSCYRSNTDTTRSIILLFVTCWYLSRQFSSWKQAHHIYCRNNPRCIWSTLRFPRHNRDRTARNHTRRSRYDRHRPYRKTWDHQGLVLLSFRNRKHGIVF